MSEPPLEHISSSGLLLFLLKTVIVDVNEVTPPLAILPGEKFVVQTYDNTSVQPNLENLREIDAQEPIFFDARIPCSIVLFSQVDLYRQEDNHTPAYMDPNSTFLPFLPRTGSIKPARVLLIMIEPKAMGLIRRQAFKRSSLSTKPIEYDYGNQSTHFTEITITFNQGQPQMVPAVKSYDTESR